MVVAGFHMTDNEIQMGLCDQRKRRERRGGSTHSGGDRVQGYRQIFPNARKLPLIARFYGPVS